MTDHIRFVEEAIRELDAQIQSAQAWISVNYDEEAEEGTVSHELDVLDARLKTLEETFENVDEEKASDGGDIAGLISSAVTSASRLRDETKDKPKEAMEEQVALMCRIREWLNNTLLDIQRPWGQ